MQCPADVCRTILLVDWVRSSGRMIAYHSHFHSPLHVGVSLQTHHLGGDGHCSGDELGSLARRSTGIAGNVVVVAGVAVVVGHARRTAEIVG